MAGRTGQRLQSQSRTAVEFLPIIRHFWAFPGTNIKVTNFLLIIPINPETHL